jgi:hypothetical protein
MQIPPWYIILATLLGLILLPLILAVLGGVVLGLASSIKTFIDLVRDTHARVR